MTESMIIDIVGEAVKTILTLSAPMLLGALIVGLTIAIFQATTQIQEATLAFVPKIIVVFLIMMLSVSWLLGSLVEFTEFIFSYISVVTQ